MARFLQHTTVQPYRPPQNLKKKAPEEILELIVGGIMNNMTVRS